jgi:hypothetical protein
VAEMASPEQAPPIGSVRARDPQVGEQRKHQVQITRSPPVRLVCWLYLPEVRRPEASGGRQDS